MDAQSKIAWRWLWVGETVKERASRVSECFGGNLLFLLFLDTAQFVLDRATESQNFFKRTRERSANTLSPIYLSEARDQRLVEFTFVLDSRPYISAVSIG